MKLATWNLFRPTPSSRKRNALVSDQITRVAADIWVLTETHDLIKPGPEFAGTSTTGADRPGGRSERWTTIWSRFPVEPLAPTSDPIRAVAARIVPTNGAPLVVYGTVLPWLGSSWCGITAGNGAAFSAALEAQASDWLALRASHPDHDIVVAGDFNQDLVHTHYYGSRANRQKLLVALERCGLVPLTAAGNDPVRAGSPPCACIDHVCISSPARWQSSTVNRWPDQPRPDPRLSDHFGIVIDFRAG